MASRFAKPVWHLVDARDQIVGRLATQIVHILRGKHKPTFAPHYDCGDVVVVINADKVIFSGRKFQNKKYRWHTGWVGGLKERTVAEQMERKPEEVHTSIATHIYLFNTFSNVLDLFHN